MSEKTASQWIEKLKLLPHPEGGYYRETYRANETISHKALPERFKGGRNFSTSIYFLLQSQDRSMFHRIQSDELWHYHAGGPLSIFILDQNRVIEHVLGPDIDKGESLQIVVPAGKWFGAQVVHPRDYTLAGCTVSPGFDFNDFEMADRDTLLKEFPEQREIILNLTK